MADIIWSKMNEKNREKYINFLKVFGALSGLFKDNQNGENARKPYLYYRNHEQLYAKVFEVEDLTRKDSAFDALAVWGDERVGIGLKTWIHTKDQTYQKVAEFNKLAPEVIAPLIQDGTPEEVIRKVSELRNDRIMLDKRLYKTTRDVYHVITRDDNNMNIVETSYDLIDLDSLELIDYTDKKVYTFRDELNYYKFYRSKSVLLERFDASQVEIIKTIPIEQFDDPFSLIKMIVLPGNDNVLHEEENFSMYQDKRIVHDEIFLPLYQDKKEGRVVSNCSGINIRNAKSKNKGSNILRPEYEIEVRISKWIHHIFPNFFGFDALDNNIIRNEDLNDFDLILPDGRVLRGRVKQQNGKSLQTNPQGALGEWILKDVLGLENREIVTMEYLEKLGIDSLKITKFNDQEFKVTVAEKGAYEKFKLENKERILQCGLTGRQVPYFRPELVEELNN